MTESNTFVPHSNTIYIGMDVHKASVSLCAYVWSGNLDDYVYVEEKRFDSADYQDMIPGYVQFIRESYDLNANVICGYEAGCTGFSLYRYLMSKSIKCVVIAPSTILEAKGNKKVKTDRLDARKIAYSLVHGCKHVHVPSEESEAVRGYLRMREDHKAELKRIKQEILSFCLAHHVQFKGTKNDWTQAHIQWLDNLCSGKQESLFSLLDRETLNEYMTTFHYLTERIERIDNRITELSATPKFEKSVKKICCIKGIDVLSAMTILSEIDDFQRFKTAEQFSSFIGLVPGEDSSGSKEKKLSITKAGNRHVRRILVEDAQCYSQGAIGKKSSKLKARQKGCDAEVIAYADKASTRLRRRYIALSFKNKSKNVTKTAVARELACFIWGMLVGKFDANKQEPVTPYVDPPQPSREKPLSLVSKKEVSPEPPSRKKPGVRASKSVKNKTDKP